MDDQQRLRERIAQLQAENAELQRPLAQLEHEHQKIHQPNKRTPHSRDESNGTRTDRPRKLPVPTGSASQLAVRLNRSASTIARRMHSSELMYSNWANRPHRSTLIEAK